MPWNGKVNLWGKNLKDRLFHFRGSLTTVLNISTIIAPGYDIFLVGNDFNNANYISNDTLFWSFQMENYMNEDYIMHAISFINYPNRQKFGIIFILFSLFFFLYIKLGKN